MAINFSIPNIPSLTKTKPDSTNTIFVPDIKYLVKFSKGDLGIADQITNSTIVNTISGAKNKSVATTYLKLAGGVVESPEKYLKDGKYNIPASAISLDSSRNQSGLKALEKSIIQSIFDSQKPYMDMFSQLSNVLIIVEDIIARVLSLPVKSLKPATNPRALGYKKGGKIITKDELAKLDSLNKNNSEISSGDSNSTQTTNGNIPNNYHYEIQSTVYSTGEFNPNVNYTYEYIDINTIEPIISGADSETKEVSKLPQTLVIAVFDNEGNMITDGHNLSWINKGKWFGNFNFLTDTDVDLYKAYYDGYTRDNLPTDISNKDKEDIANKVNLLNSNENNKNIKEHISSLKSDGYFPSVKYNNADLLTTYDNSGKTNTISLKQAFAPKKININGGDIWIDPESDYDFKLIRCDSVNKNNDDDINHVGPFSNGVYGGDDNNREDIGQIYRNSGNDTESDLTSRSIHRGEKLNKTYYVLEGILTENNNQSFDILNGKSSSDGFSYYKKKAFFSAPKQFIKLTIQIASKLTPAISAIIKIAAEPNKFVTNIMKLNLGDNLGAKDVKFIFFSSEFAKKFSSLNNSKDKQHIIKNSVLKNFVVLNKDGSHKFLLSGSGFSFLRNKKIGHKVDPNLTFATFSSSYPKTLKPNNLAGNIDYSSLKFVSYNESETIDYIGGYNPNITYQYIYVTKYVLNLLQEAEESEESGDLDTALSKYNEAQKLDPSNKTITDKIDALKKLMNSFGGNALFGFILNMITLPLEIVVGIVEEIIKILKKFTSPTTLKEAIADLVAFKIFPGGLNPVEFFKPTNVLKIAKISFNIDLFMEWISGVLVKPLEEYDLNKIIQLPFVSSFPKYNTAGFKSLIFGHKGKKPNILPLKMLTSILKIFEGIINAIISFFWALMGLAGILKKPILKFTKDSNTDISASDIQALVNGTYTDIIDPNSTIDPNYNFIYNIQLPDGRTIRQLDTIELQQFIDDNSEFTYVNNF